jgi:hypothetical protein
VTAVAGLFGAGAAFQSLGVLQQSESQASAYEYNRKVALQNARVVREQGRADAAQQRVVSTKALGAMRANYGASGVAMDGSALDILEESTMQAELENQNILYNAEVQAIGYINQARVYKYAASTTRTGGFLSSAAAALGGAASVMASLPVGSSQTVGTPLRV